MSSRELSYADAIREATFQVMEEDDNVVVIGEGVPDPKNIFGTTKGLQEKFGGDRVFDMPLSENGLTGICIGAAQSGLRPLMVHQRNDFMMLAMDQIVNHAAKWPYLFGSNAKIPLVIRALIGRGWGQGPQHAQSLQSLFAHIPGLRVVMPSNAYDAKGMLISSIRDNNPVVYLEHRWLHATTSYVPEVAYESPLEGANVVKSGSDITIVAMSYMVVEALRAADWLLSHGVEAEIVDVRSVRPLDIDTVVESIRKTGRLLVLDTAWKTVGVSAEIVARVAEESMSSLRCPPARLALAEQPAPTSVELTSAYYPEAEQIARQALMMLESDDELIEQAVFLRRKVRHDVPNNEFLGPF